MCGSEDETTFKNTTITIEQHAQETLTDNLSNVIYKLNLGVNSHWKLEKN